MLTAPPLFKTELSASWVFPSNVMEDADIAPPSSSAVLFLNVHPVTETLVKGPPTKAPPEVLA